MCGIAGRILNAPGKVGQDLVELMDAQEHRGAARAQMTANDATKGLWSALFADNSFTVE